ncbi:MAG: PqqD family protein [Gammaproteobacteria bacterium]|nr:PqqD family protein [Gammaproteobacteria bacterium]
MSSGSQTAFDKVKKLCYIRRQEPETITREEEINGEKCFIVFDDVDKGFYQLHGNAWQIWEMLDGKTSLEAIVDILCVENEAERDEIQVDVCKFISKIGKKGLIKAAVKVR